MPQNDFKPFAIGSGANVTSQADWEALSALSTGFQSGKASSAQVNKALRQGTFVASALAQFITVQTNSDVLDSGEINAFVALLENALGVFATGRLLNVKTYTASGTYSKSAGTKHIRVRVWGAGGGGANTTTAGQASGGGCGGGYAEGYYDVSDLSTATITIGSGGANVPALTLGSGGNGGTSSFGTLISATGGTGSIPASAGGKGTGGNLINFTANAAQGSLTTGVAGSGGASYASSTAAPHISVPGDDGSFPGGGGAGGNGSQASGKGASGFIIIEEYS